MNSFQLFAAYYKCVTSEIAMRRRIISAGDRPSQVIRFLPIVLQRHFSYSIRVFITHSERVLGNIPGRQWQIPLQIAFLLPFFALPYRIEILKTLSQTTLIRFVVFVNSPVFLVRLFHSFVLIS